MDEYNSDVEHVGCDNHAIASVVKDLLNLDAFKGLYVVDQVSMICTYTDKPENEIFSALNYLLENKEIQRFIVKNNLKHFVTYGVRAGY